MNRPKLKFVLFLFLILFGGVPSVFFVADVSADVTGQYFFEDFENINANGWTFSNGSGAVYPNSTDARYAGSYGCKIIWKATNGYMYVAVTSKSECYVGVWFQSSTDAATGTSAVLPYSLNAAGNVIVGLGYTNAYGDGTADNYGLYVDTDGDGTREFHMVNETLAGGEWHFLLIGVSIGNSGWARLWKDGTLKINLTGIDNNFFGATVTRLYLWGHGTKDYQYWDNLRAATSYFLPTISNVDVEVLNFEGCGNWLFAEERFYHFNATYSHANASGNATEYFDTCRIAFSDGYSWINASYNCANDTFRLEDGWTVANVKRGGQGEEDISEYEILETGTYLSIVFDIFLEADIIDAFDVDVYMWSNDTTGLSTGWDLKKTDYFHIYSAGGKNFHLEIGNNGYAGRFDTGGAFHFWARNNSYVEADMVFRKLNHIKLLPRIYCTIGYPAFYIYYYIEYCTEDTAGSGVDLDPLWIRGLEIEMKAVSVTVGSERRFNWTVTYTARNSTGSLVQIYQKSIYTFPWAGTASGHDTATRLWADLWFDTLNGSTVLAGRINSYYYPMKDSAESWLRWLSSNWGPDDRYEKETVFYAPIRDTDGTVLSTQQLKLIRIMSRLWVTAADGDNDQYVITDYYEIDTDKTPVGEPFQGWTSPVFDETNIPSMKQTGFLGAILAGFGILGDWLGSALGAGALRLWDTFVGFLDTVFGLFGWRNGFSDIVGWIASFFGWIATSFGYLISAITPFFMFLASFLGKALNTLSTILGNWVNVINGVWDMLGDGANTGVHIWNDLGLATWVILGAILYPIYLVWIWDTKGFDAVIAHIKMMLDIGAFVLHILITVIQIFLNLIGRIIESIPVVE